MRCHRVLVAAAVMLASLAAASGTVRAESLLQRWLGFGRGEAAEPRYERPDPYPYSRPSYDYDDNDWREDTRTYRTMCVRMCDGFYFPMSNGVRRGRLYQDSRACMQRCDGEARLFYYPIDGGSVETMVDLAGRSYRALPNAFRYRKALVDGCACKPAPWSPEEAARHQGYANEDATAEAEADESDAEIRAAEARSARASGPSVEESYYFEPPQPYARPPAPRAYSRWRHPRYGWRN
jgi:Protein of unknown function (DUF2865)